MNRPRRAASRWSRPRQAGRVLPGFERLPARLPLAADGLLPAYDIGSPTVVDIWVDPVAGDDAAAGGTRSAALRTVGAAWRRVPMNTDLATGYRINLVAGTYPESIVPTYWESRHGSHDAPVMIVAADGDGTAKLPNLNLFDCRFLYLVGLDVSSAGGDVVHFEASSDVLLRRCTIRGLGTIADFASPQETLKVNQSQRVYVEGCDISGAWDNAVDFVGVQYGHVVGNRIHRSLDWAMYVKGGSASLTIAGNEFYDAGTGGFTAGQGTGFEFMTAPWIHYEAYDIRFVANVIHDTQGAGMGVNGGYNILLAHNTLYRVGARSHVLEVGFGSRSCDADTATCTRLRALGGWGPVAAGDAAVQPIPDRHVYILNNVILNPAGFASQWQQFAVADPQTPAPDSNIPSPARVDDDLRILGNVIWNGPPDHPLGFSNPDLVASVTGGNTINSVMPVLVNPAIGDYRLDPSVPLPLAVPIPAFPGGDAPTRPAVPEGSLDTAVRFDYLGQARSEGGIIGAFAAGSPAPPPTPTPSPTPSPTPTPTPTGPDLTGTLTAKLLSGVAAGKSGSARLVVRNAGPGDVRGPLDAQFFLVRDGDSATDSNRVAVLPQRTVVLRVGRTVTLTGRFRYPDGADGRYTLVARFNTAGAIPERDLANDTVTGPATSLVQPRINLQVTAFTAPVRIAPGRVQYSVTVRNAGTVAATTQGTLRLLQSTDAVRGDDIVLLTTPQRISLAPNAARTFRIVGRIGSTSPVAAAFIGVTLDATTAPADVTLDDNVRFANAPVAVS